MNALDNIRIVLVEPTHPGNIGATARAMANMGISDLVLVSPREFPSPDATARAAGADYLLNAARVVAHLDDAIADCDLVLGASARTRSIQWPQLSPREAMAKVTEQSPKSRTALLFGRERSGLTNAELERCHYLMRIPVDEKYPSLNIAAAVIVFLYELRCAVESDDVTVHSDKGAKPEAEPHATANEMHHFYEHLKQLLVTLDFANTAADKLHRKLARLFNRARPYSQEVRLLRGIFNEVEEKLKGKR